jgi:Tol biopolymer transport system component
MSIARRSRHIIAGLALILLVGCRDHSPASPPGLRLQLDLPVELVLGGGPDDEFGLALAPDGRRLAFVAAREGAARSLWLRDLSSGDLHPLSGTDDAMMPFWSHDGSRVGYFAGGKLRVHDFASGRNADLAGAAAPRGAVWLPGGEIVFAASADAGLSIRSTQGVVSEFTTLAAGELSHRLPQRSGDDRVVFFVRSSESARHGIWMAPISDPNARQRLASSEAAALVLDDTLVYSNGGALVAQPLTADERAPRTRAELLATGIGHGLHHQLFATVGGDVLIYGRPASALRELRWIDRTGTVQGVLGERMQAWQSRISPVAPQVAIARVDPQLGTLDIWLYRDREPVPRRISSSINVDDTPVWSRDGAHIAWISARTTLTIRAANPGGPSLSTEGPSGQEVVVHQFAHQARVSDWSPDGQAIIVTAVQADGHGDIVVVGARAGSDPRPYLRTPFHEGAGVLSPDGRWLAYESDESGRTEIYVDRFPAAGARARLTLGGGAEPRWNKDGSALFFRRGAEVHAVTLARTGNELKATSSSRLFDAGAEIRTFDVSPDGQRFLINVPAPDARATPLTVLVNVRSLLPSAR